MPFLAQDRVDWHSVRVLSDGGGSSRVSLSRGPLMSYWKNPTGGNLHPVTVEKVTPPDNTMTLRIKSLKLEFVPLAASQPGKVEMNTCRGRDLSTPALPPDPAAFRCPREKWLATVLFPALGGGDES